MFQFRVWYFEILRSIWYDTDIDTTAKKGDIYNTLNSRLIFHEYHADLQVQVYTVIATVGRKVAPQKINSNSQLVGVRLTGRVGLWSVQEPGRVSAAGRHTKLQ